MFSFQKPIYTFARFSIFTNFYLGVTIFRGRTCISLRFVYNFNIVKGRSWLILIFHLEKLQPA
jgi:hypothetical protein